MASLTWDATSVIGRLEALGRNLPGETLSAMVIVAEQIMEVSRSRTPVLTGALRDSHQIIIIRLGEHIVAVEIAVGGPAAPYALFVHENPYAHHDVGQYKFLESAILEAAPDLLERISAQIDLLKATRA